MILREVLGFSAKEVADALDTTVASVNSALQPARAAVQERIPEQSQQATLRSLGDEGVRQLVGRDVSAWERCDIEAFTAMLAEDATFAMPPLRNWYQGREAIAIWAATSLMSGEWRWRTQPARANGQIALGFYAWNATEEAHLPFALNVLTLRGGEVADVTAFIARSAEPRARELFARYPAEPPDAARVGRCSGASGLRPGWTDPGASLVFSRWRTSTLTSRRSRARPQRHRAGFGG